jgi:hypothetical protein
MTSSPPLFGDFISTTHVQCYTVCLVGERRERSGADPCFGDGSDPSRVLLEMLGWSGSDPFFLVWLKE